MNTPTIDLHANAQHIDLEALNRDLIDYRDQVARLRTALEIAHADTRRLDFLGGNLRSIIDAAMGESGDYVSADQPKLFV